MALRLPSTPRTRERDLVRATRALFDERGMQDAPIEEIARAAGIARGLVYRHFSSKEELYVLTVTDYLDELAPMLEAVLELDPADAARRLEAHARAYSGFCARYPAFVDSALSLMRRPAADLRNVVSESVWLRLGQGMARCIDPLVIVLRDGARDGAFRVEDPEYLANVLWTQTLGVAHLARIRVGLRQLTPGVPDLFTVKTEQVVQTCVDTALGLAGSPAG